MARFPPVRRLAVLLLCGTVLLAACRRQSDPQTPATTTALPATTQVTQPTTTPTTVDVSAPPTPAQLQDTAYWNAVLAALNHVAAEAVRSTVRTRAVEPSAVEALRQVYGPEVFEGQHESLMEIAAGEDNGLLNPPGDPVAATTRIVRISGDCVGLIASLDYRMVNPTLSVSSIGVELRAVSRSGGSVNPTPWMISRQFVLADESNTRFLCAG